MNYLIYGDEIGRVSDMIAKTLKHHHMVLNDLNVTRYSLKETSLEEIVVDAQTISLFDEQKAIVVYDCDFLGGGAGVETESLSLYLQHPNAETVLVLVGYFEKCDQRKKIVKLVNQTCRVIRCAKLSEQERRSYVAQRCRELAIRCEQSVFESLLNRLSFDMIELEHQLELLSCYPDQLDSDVVKQLIVQRIEDNVFELVNMLLKGRYDKVFAIWNDLDHLNREPVFLISVLASQFRFYYQVKSCMAMKMNEEGIAQKLKAHPYRVKLAMASIKRISLSQLLTMLNLLAEADQQIKSGKVDKKLAFEMFLIKSKGVLSL